MPSDKNFFSNLFRRSKKVNNNKDNVYKDDDAQDGREQRHVKFGRHASHSDDEYECDKLARICNPYHVETQPKRIKAPQSLPGEVGMLRGNARRASRRYDDNAAAMEDDVMNRSFQSEFLSGPSTSAYATENTRRHRHHRSHRGLAPTAFPPSSSHVDYIDESSTQSSANNMNHNNYYIDRSSIAGSRRARSKQRRSVLRERNESTTDAEIMWLRQENYNLQKDLESARGKYNSARVKRYALEEKHNSLILVYEQLLKENANKDRIVSQLKTELNQYKSRLHAEPLQSHQIADTIRTPQTHVIQSGRNGVNNSARSYQQRYENNFSYGDSSLTRANNNNSASIALTMDARELSVRHQRNAAHLHHNFKQNSAEVHGSGESLAERTDTSMISGGTNTKTASNSTDVGEPNRILNVNGANTFPSPFLPPNAAMAALNINQTRPLHKTTGSLPHGHLGSLPHGNSGRTVQQPNTFNDISMLSAMYSSVPEGRQQLVTPINSGNMMAPLSLPTRHHHRANDNNVLAPLNVANSMAMNFFNGLSTMPAQTLPAINNVFRSTNKELKNFSTIQDEGDTNDEVKPFRNQHADSSLHDTDGTEELELERDKRLLGNDSSINTSSGTNSHIFSSPEREETARGGIGSSTDESLCDDYNAHKSPDVSSGTMTATLAEDSSSSPCESMPFSDNTTYEDDEDGVSTCTSLSYQKADQRLTKKYHHSNSASSILYANIPITQTQVIKATGKSRSARHSGNDADDEDKENRARPHLI